MMCNVSIAFRPNFKVFVDLKVLKSTFGLIYFLIKGKDFQRFFLDTILSKCRVARLATDKILLSGHRTVTVHIKLKLFNYTN